MSHADGTHGVGPKRRARQGARPERNRSSGGGLDERAFADAILQSLPGIFYLFDPDGRMLRWNRNLELVSGYSAAEITTMHPRDFFDRADYPLIEQRVAETFAAGQSHLEANLVAKDGTRTPYYFSGVRTAIGSKPALMGVGIDISERRRAERSLRDLSVAIDASGDIVLMTDKDGIIVSINPQFTESYGYSGEDVVGKVTPRILKSGMQTADFYAEFWAAIMRGELVRGEVVNRTRDGRLIWVEETVNPFRDSSGNIAGFLAIQRDITARRRAEEEVRQLNAALEQRVAERTAQLEVANRELESFAYSVSHDLRAPLRAIDGFSAALLTEHGETIDPRGRHYLERVRAGTQRMGDLITDLLDLSRVTRHALVHGTVDLSRLALGIAHDLRDRGPSREIEFVIEEGVLADGDPRLLQIVLTNLLENAWKFTAPRRAARVEFGSETEAGERRFFVRDNGVGLDMRYAGKLFGAFQRLHSAREFPGTGIGLATVQRIVNRHGGRIWVKSAVGDGATFYFTLGR